MIPAKLRLCMAAALVFASVALPFVLWRSGRASLHEVRELSAKQAGELAQLTEDSQRLSNLVARAKQPLSAEQIKELLRLRGEIGRLSAETHEADKLRGENHLLKATSAATASPQISRPPAELEAELSTQTINAMKNICLELPQVLQRFANDHSNQPPSLPELRSYFPSTDGRRMPGLYTFTFVRDEGPKRDDLLILREEGSRGKLDGKMARVYGFRDGSAVEVTSEHGDFDAWEKEHLSTPSSAP